MPKHKLGNVKKLKSGEDGFKADEDVFEVEHEAPPPQKRRMTLAKIDKRIMDRQEDRARLVAQHEARLAEVDERIESLTEMKTAMEVAP